MTALTLANLLTKDNDAFKDIVGHMNRGGHAAPYVAITILVLFALLAAGYSIWHYRHNEMLRPRSRTLLRRCADMLGLSADHRRLLLHLGRSVDMEPAAALISPSMLMELVRRVEADSGKLPRDEAAQVAEVLDAVTAAARDDGNEASQV